MDALLHLLARILITLFLLGLAGSLLVVILTVLRDLRQVWRGDKPAPAPQ